MTREEHLERLLKLAREEIVQLYTKISRGDRESGERFAKNGGVVMTIDRFFEDEQMPPLGNILENILERRNSDGCGDEDSSHCN